MSALGYPDEYSIPSNEDRLSGAIGRFVDAMHVLSALPVRGAAEAEELRHILSQAADRAKQAQYGAEKMLERFAARERDIVASISQFEPRPIGHCAGCGRALYERPHPIDKTATLCDLCYGDLTQRIERTPDLARSIVAALRLSGGMR